MSGRPREIERDALVDRRADLARQRDEIGDRAEMDVRRVVPGMGQAFGHRHAAREGDLGPNAPMAEIRHRNDGAAANAQHVFEHDARLARRLQRLRQDDIVESVIRIVDEIGVGVALNDRQSLGDAIVDAVLGELDAPPVDAPLFGQEAQQFPVAAADVENAGLRRDKFRHAQQVDARRSERSGKVQSTPLARAAASMKPFVVSMSSGTSSRKASCPRSVSISTKETEAPPAFSARTVRSRVAGGKQPVGGEGDDAEAGSRAFEGARERSAIVRGEVEIVHRPRHVEIGVGIEAFDEDRALVTQVGFNLKIRVEGEGARRAVLEIASELAMQRALGEVGDVSRHARDAEALAGPRALDEIAPAAASPGQP